MVIPDRLKTNESYTFDWNRVSVKYTTYTNQTSRNVSGFLNKTVMLLKFKYFKITAEISKIQCRITMLEWKHNAVLPIQPYMIAKPKIAQIIMTLE